MGKLNWRSLFGVEDTGNNYKNGIGSTEKKSEVNLEFVTESEESDFEASMYGKIQSFKNDVPYIEEIFPSEGYDLERQIELITKLLEQTNDEDDPQIKEIFATLEEQYIKIKRLADGEYTIRQLGQQNSAMDKRFESAGISENELTQKELDSFKEYIDLIQEKVNDGDKDFGEPLLTNVQRQRFNSISMKAEYRIKMLELMYLLSKESNEDDIVNPFDNLSKLKQRMFAGYFLDDAKAATDQYNSASKQEELYGKFYFNIFPELNKVLETLDDDLANASMIGDFSVEELFDSANPSVNSFDFLRKFAKFKLKLNDIKIRVKTLDSKKAERDKREADDEKARQENAARKKAAEEAILAKEEQERAKREAIEAEKKAKQLEEIEKKKNMTPEEIKKEIYRIEHDLSAKGSRFVNILEFQKDIARARGLLDTEKEIQREDLTYKVVDITTLEALIKQLDEAGTNYVVFPDCQEFDSNGYLVIVSNTDSDKLKVSSSVPYGNMGYRDVVDESLGKYPLGVLKLLYSKLKDKYGDNYYSVLRLGDKDEKSKLYELSYIYDEYEGRPRGYREQKEKITSTLLDIKKDLENGSRKTNLKDVLCYIEIHANENIIPILEKMKDNEIPAFIEPNPTDKRNEKNRDNIRIYFRREDLQKYLDTVNTEFLDKRRFIPIKWGEDASIDQELLKSCEWFENKTK